MAVVWTAMRSGSGSGGFFTYMMSGSAGGVLHALFAIVILVMWRTSSWIGADGL